MRHVDCWLDPQPPAPWRHLTFADGYSRPADWRNWARQDPLRPARGTWKTQWPPACDGVNSTACETERLCPAAKSKQDGTRSCLINSKSLDMPGVRPAIKAGLRSLVEVATPDMRQLRRDLACLSYCGTDPCASFEIRIGGSYRLFVARQS